MANAKTLLSVQEAAGYTMAPLADEMDAPSSMIVNRSLDDALRLGHISASRPVQAHGGQALVLTRVVVDPAKAALKGVMSVWWMGKAHA